jgi:phenylacetate-CoA ligase
MNRLHDGLLTIKGILLYEKFLKKSISYSDEEIKIWQDKWLSTLLKHCYKNIPSYSSSFRESGLDINSKDPLRELQKLPIVSKRDIHINHGSFCVAGAAMKSVRFSTSGTTGEPMTAYTSFNQWVFEQGIVWRQWKDAGYNFRDKMAIFRSYAPRDGQPLIKKDRLRNWSYFSVFDMNESDIQSYVEYLQKWKPKFLRGYPSALNLVAEHALRNGWQLPSLKAAFSASEVVPVNLRENLRHAFGIELFDHYGQAEITAMFHECGEHDGLHVNWEYGLVELLPTNEKDVYRIVATNLHNLSMPLLRYDTGDLAVGFWKECACGRSSLKIDSIRGRQDDYLIMYDGSRASPTNLYTYFAQFSQVQKFQLIQEKAGELVVMVEFSGVVTEDRWRELSGRVVNDLSSKTKLLIKCPREPHFVQSGQGKFSAFLQRVKNVS